MPTVITTDGKKITTLSAKGAEAYIRMNGGIIEGQAPVEPVKAIKKKPDAEPAELSTSEDDIIEEVEKKRPGRKRTKNIGAE